MHRNIGLTSDDRSNIYTENDSWRKGGKPVCNTQIVPSDTALLILIKGIMNLKTFYFWWTPTNLCNYPKKETESFVCLGFKSSLLRFLLFLEFFEVN